MSRVFLSVGFAVVFSLNVARDVWENDIVVVFLYWLSLVLCYFLFSVCLHLIKVRRTKPPSVQAVERKGGAEEAEHRTRQAMRGGWRVSEPSPEVIALILAGWTLLLACGLRMWDRSGIPYGAQLLGIWLMGTIVLRLLYALYRTLEPHFVVQACGAWALVLAASSVGLLYRAASEKHSLWLFLAILPIVIVIFWLWRKVLYGIGIREVRTNRSHAG